MKTAATRTLTLRADVLRAMARWEQRVLGKSPRQIAADLTDPLTLTSLDRQALPGEDLNDTILRLIAQDPRS